MKGRRRKDPTVMMLSVTEVLGERMARLVEPLQNVCSTPLIETYIQHNHSCVCCGFD